MARILAYTSPALGHMLPMSALLCELRRRGHDIALRTLSTAVDAGRGFGFDTEPIDPRIEAIQLDDWQGTSRGDSLKRGIAAFGRRAEYEVADLREAIDRVNPDFLLLDINCWGALSVGEAGSISWACFSPYVPPLRAPGLPPFGPGLPPLAGALGRMRDAAVHAVVTRSIERAILPTVNAVRARLDLPAAPTVDEFLRGAPLLLIASGTPFQYPDTQWGNGVHLIGPCLQEASAAPDPDWLTAITRPIVLVTTSSEQQSDAELVSTAIAALRDDDVHIVATLPTGIPPDLASSPHVTVARFVPHGAVLDRAVCAVTHGGMGATQKALAHGVPVCVVPYGRDQFEVARRVQVAGCGTRLPATKLSADRLRAKVHQAMGMAAGAAKVQAGFDATGGVARGADLIESALRGARA